MSNEMRHESVSENGGGGCGEIVEVEGGHIVRSTGRKDRHSKVCTAKGPRDRRVRLSAPTAIQFYDVQDRLGFDRPSKAVDWLINKAKSAIDDLDQLPPWNPVDTLRQHAEMVNSRPRRRTSKTETETEQNHHQNETSFLLPASLDSDSIADTIKSFFPVVPPQSYHHHHQPPPPSSDLRLSLQSFQNGESFGNQTEHALFSGQSIGFDSSWEQNQHQSPEFGRIQRVMTWNNGGVSEGGGGGYVSSSPVAPTTSFQPVYGQSQFLSTPRGPLQSINTPMIRGWFDPNHHHHNHNHNHQSITSDDLQHHQHQNQPYHVPSAIPGIAFASANGEFSGFRIHQDDNKPSSASSDSRH